jgi:hypothetical protein
MFVFDVEVKASVSSTYRVVAKDENEARKMAELMFSNENGNVVLAAEFDVRPENVQSPIIEDAADPQPKEFLGLGA